MAKRIPPHERFPETVKLYKSGLDLRGVAKFCGVTHQCISLRLKVAGCPRRRAGVDFRIPDEQACVLRRRYEEGETVKEIADDLDFSYWLIRKAIRRVGCKIGVRKHVRQDYSAQETPVPVVAEIIRRYSAGELARHVADATGVSVQTVYNIIHRAGVPTRIKRRYTSPPLEVEIAGMLRQRGFSLREIGEALGLTRMQTHHRIDVYNWSQKTGE